MYDQFVPKFVEGYKTKLRIGDPLQPGVNVGPVHHERSVKLFRDTVAFYKEQGSKMLVGGSVIDGNFVQPTVFEAPADKGVNYDAIKTEYFTPVVHVVKFSGDVQEVVDAVNSTGYGLSCGVFTT